MSVECSRSLSRFIWPSCGEPRILSDSGRQYCRSGAEHLSPPQSGQPNAPEIPVTRHRSLHLVCYDVASDARRRAVRRVLAGYRVGGQESALECLFTPSELRDVLRDVEARIDKVADRVQIVRLDPRMPGEGWGVARIHRVGEPLLVL